MNQVSGVPERLFTPTTHPRAAPFWGWEEVVPAAHPGASVRNPAFPRARRVARDPFATTADQAQASSALVRDVN